MLRKGLAVYIFLLPFTSAFALTSTITLSVVWSCVLLLLFVIYIFRRGEVRNPLTVENLLVGGILTGILIAYVVNGFLQVKPTNHLIAYTVTFVLFFGLINQLLLEIGPTESNLTYILRWLLRIMVFVALFAIAEFAFRMAIGINIGNYLPRPFRGEYTSSTLDAFLVRVRGFTEESGQHAFISEAFLPIALFTLYYHTRLGAIFKTGIATILILSFLLAFSAGGFLAICSGLVFAASYHLIFRHVSLTTLLKIGAGVGVAYFLLLSFLNIDLFYTLYAIVEAKTSGGGSLDDRSGRIDEFLLAYQQQSLLHQLVGFGPSGFRILGLEKSILSLYPTFLNEGGAIGITCFTLFLGYIFRTITQIQGVIKIFLLVSFFACTVHFIIIADYFRPWFWFFCALVLFVYRVENSAKVKKREINQE